MVVCFHLTCVFSYSVRVQKVKFELFLLVQFLFFLYLLCISEHALTEKTLFNNSDTHTHFSFFSFGCLSYIHTSYLFCTLRIARIIAAAL